MICVYSSKTNNSDSSSLIHLVLSGFEWIEWILYAEYTISNKCNIKKSRKKKPKKQENSRMQRAGNFLLFICDNFSSIFNFTFFFNSFSFAKETFQTQHYTFLYFNSFPYSRTDICIICKREFTFLIWTNMQHWMSA